MRDIERTARINLRLTPGELALIRRAADQEGETVTSYIIKHCIDEEKLAGLKGAKK